MKKDLFFLDDDGGYIRLPRALVNMIFDCIDSCKPCWVYLWMLTKAAYGTISKSNHVILNRGEIELNVIKMTEIFKCSDVYLYRIINQFVKQGLIRKKNEEVYELPMYDKHCCYIMDKKAFVDQSKLQGSFKEFWTVYHRFLNIPETDRYRTERMWAKMSPDEREQALQYIQNYKAYTKGHNYKKSAYNYLKDKMYYTKKE